MAAADDEGEEGGVRLPGLRIETWGTKILGVHKDGVDVAFQVVDGYEGEIGAEGEGLGETDANQQGTGEARTFGDGYGGEIGVGDARLLHGFADDGDDGAEMLARGELGDDAAVVAVDELRGDDVGQDFMAVADDRCGGLVAGAFDTEDEAAGHEVYRTRQEEADSRE